MVWLNHRLGLSCFLLGIRVAESGMGGRYWFRAMISGKDASNSTYHERIRTTPHHYVFEKPKNVSKFRAF